MVSTRYQFRFPKYMADFRCIGSDCEFHCCRMWIIYMEKPIYDQLKNIMGKTPEMVHRFHESIKLNTDPARNPMEFAHIQLLPNKVCPFFENKLCAIQNHFGEKMLSSTCSIYPRKQYVADDMVEISAHCSCPEVCRRLLLDRDAMTLQTGDEYHLNRKTYMLKVRSDDASPYHKLLNPIRNFMVRLIQLDQYSLEERLFFMTFFAKRTAEYFHQETASFEEERVENEKQFLLRNLDEIKRKLESIETPKSVMFILIEKVLMTSKAFEALECGDIAMRVLSSYENSVAQGSLNPLEKVWDVYYDAKDRIRLRAKQRIQQYLINIAKDFWINNWYIRSSNLLEHMEKLLIWLGLFKFLLFSQPQLVKALDDEDNKSGFLSVLDEMAVEVLFKVGRYLDHSSILKDITAAMEKDKLPPFLRSLYLLKL